LSLTLKPITKFNWEDAIQLRVHQEQETFIASNLYSIAQVQFLENFLAMGIYLDEIMIGFTLFGIDSDDGNYWIYRLMIDSKYQGHGYGSEAVLKVIEEIRKQNSHSIPCIMIGYHQDNEGARQTYKKAGFCETEIAPWGEQLAKYDF
jgi:diamine N-acetyltransferase